MSRIITCEQVSAGHPDKICDQIADAIVTDCLKHDRNSRVAIECLFKNRSLVIAGELSSKHKPDYKELVYQVFERIGMQKLDYGKSVDFRDSFFLGPDIGILVKEQSPDIAMGVDKGGAGDQGMMFGYATNETESYMPVSLDLAHLIMRTLADIRKEGKEMTYLRPDAKSQVTVQYSDEGIPECIDTIVVSTQHDEFDEDEKMLAKIKDDVINILIPRVKQQIHSQKVLDLFGLDIKYYVNPTGKFVIGGPHGDTGLTGRKIIVDTYGGKGAHGGGAFSGKDSSKVDRSAAYAARHIAKNMVAAGVADEMLVQVSYAIGVAKPMNIYVNTYGRSNVKMSDGEIAKKIEALFDLRPKAIERSLKLRQPMYAETAAYGHMGRKSEIVKKTFTSHYHETKTIDVELFTWEKLDRVEDIRQAFGLS
jgi:S-adenosylmethionine synthetase